MEMEHSTPDHAWNGMLIIGVKMHTVSSIAGSRHETDGYTVIQCDLSVQ